MKKTLPLNNINKLLLKISTMLLVLFLLTFILSFRGGFHNELDTLKKILGEAESNSSIIENKIRISREYHKQKTHTDDILIAIQAAEDALLLNNTFLYARALNNLGLLYCYHQQYADAIPLHKKAFDITEHLDILPLDKMISNPEKALAYYKISQQYKDSINLSNQETEIAAINNRYNFEKKESEIELLKKDRSLQDSRLATNEAKLRNKSTIIFLMTFSLFSLLLLVFIQQRNRRIRLKTEKRLQQQEKEKIQAIYEKNLMEAEMLASRMQVNPHFLFNCLNSIKYLIQSKQNEKAIEYLVIFCRFIRMVLETSQKPLSTICEELELLRFYLKLEENRFNDDFSFSIENKISEDLNNIILPTLLMQPFVENAIWHGLLPSENPKKTITISVDSHEKGVLIVIDDNGVGRKKAEINDLHNSMGNEITHKRIQLFNKNYPNLIELNIVDKVDSIGNPTGTSINLLIHKEAESIPPQKELFTETFN